MLELLPPSGRVQEGNGSWFTRFSGSNPSTRRPGAGVVPVSCCRVTPGNPVPRMEYPAGGAGSGNLYLFKEEDTVQEYRPRAAVYDSLEQALPVTIHSPFSRGRWVTGQGCAPYTVTVPVTGNTGTAKVPGVAVSCNR